MTFVRFIGRFLVLATLVALIAPAGLARAGELPSGWQRYTAGEYQIGAPKGWNNVALERAEIVRVIGVIAKDNPEFASALQRLVDTGQYRALKLFVINPASGENLTYATTTLPLKLTPKQLADAATDMLPRQLPGATILNTRSDATLNGMAAARVEYELGFQKPQGGAKTLHGVQYYVPVGNTLHVVTLTGAPSSAFVSLADTIAGTFERGTGQPQSTAGPSATARVNGNVRAAASVRAKIVAKLKTGEAVTLLGKKRDASWFSIRTARGVNGWASATILKVDATAAGQLPILP